MRGCGGVRLPGIPKPDGTPTLSRYVDVGAGFETHRLVVEAVSVLFELYEGDAASYTASGSPGEPLPTGWLVTAAKFEVDWPTEAARAALVRSYFGARRFADSCPDRPYARPGRPSPGPDPTAATSPHERVTKTHSTATGEPATWPPPGRPPHCFARRWPATWPLRNSATCSLKMDIRQDELAIRRYHAG